MLVSRQTFKIASQGSSPNCLDVYLTPSGGAGAYGSNNYGSSGSSSSNSNRNDEYDYYEGDEYKRKR